MVHIIPVETLLHDIVLRERAEYAHEQDIEAILNPLSPSSHPRRHQASAYRRRDRPGATAVPTALHDLDGRAPWEAGAQLECVVMTPSDVMV
jgi:hypothetical protein